MRYLLRITSLMILTLFIVSIETSVAGEEELNDLSNAKLAHHRAKQRMLDGRKSSEERERDGSQGGSCGSLNVGNVSNQRGAKGPREVTVIVTGDIINANNNCR